MYKIYYQIKITELKAEILKVTEVPMERQRLVYMGKLVKNEDTLDKYGIFNININMILYII